MKIELNEGARWRYMEGIEIRPAITWAGKAKRPKKIKWLALFLWTIVLACVMVNSCNAKVTFVEDAEISLRELSLSWTWRLYPEEPKPTEKPKIQDREEIRTLPFITKEDL